MQGFEAMAIVIAIVMLGFIMLSKNDKRQLKALLISIAIVGMTLHLVLEQARWQLYPLYSALIIMGVLLYLKDFMHKKLRNGWHKGVFTFLTALIVLTFFSVLVFPIREVPSPTGEHSVGTVSFVIEDKDRDESYGEEPGTDRRFKIQAWYPAEMTDGYEEAPWIDDGKTVARGLSRDVGLPFFTLDHTEEILSHAYRDAPVKEASEPYPVVILSHGWRGFRNLHTDVAEELASQGYIVFGIDHAYGSVATVISEDETLYLDPEALPDRETTPDFLDYANELVSTYAGDITATLDHLESMDDDTHLDGLGSALDLENIGLIGHSTGGGADALVALEDARIDAFIGLDAWVEPLDEDSMEEGLSVPSLFLRSGDWEESYNNAHLTTLIENSEDAVLYQIDGTTHSDFAMVYMISPLTKVIGFSGDVESERLTPMLKSMITDFFGGTLKDEGGRDIDPDMWKEVRRIQ